jgi:asparagine synthase (glutamine-hydrolysing)
VSRVARESGLTVALSGLGGDELFAGYELFRTAPQLERIRGRVPRLPRQFATLAGRVTAGGGDRGRKLGRWLAGELGSAYELHREVLEPAARVELLGPLGNHPSRRSGLGADPVNALSLLELTTYMRDVLLRDADVMSMAHGLEVRVPLLDQDLVAEVAGLPGEMKLDPKREKGLLIDAVGELLPESVTRRPKMGFTLPFEAWLRGPLRHEVAEALLTPAFGGQVAAALDPLAVAKVWRAFESGRTSWSRPWTLYAAKVWGEHNLAQPQPAAAASGREANASTVTQRSSPSA